MGIVSRPADRLAGPEQPAVEEIAAYVVAAAVWAPSVHNTQPWWFSAGGQELSLHADAGRQLRVADPRGREMMISCGAALFTARLALRSVGYVPQTSVLPGPGEPLLVARVSWQRRAAAAEYEQRLYGQVWRRRTHRGGFDPGPIPPDLVAMLQEGAKRDGAMLRIVDSAGNQAVLAAAVETAEQALRMDGRYARELASWASPPGSTRRDGVPRAPASPGTIHRLTASQLETSGIATSSHGFGLPDALRLGRALERLPRRMVILAVEGADTASGSGLSEAVAAAVPHAVAAVVAELGRIRSVD